MKAADRPWAERATRRWGALIAWSLAKGQPLTMERSAVLQLAAWGMQVDRRLWLLERRMWKR
jgi:hypothetical protein